MTGEPTAATERHAGKIFCIGPNKTGTSSLHNAFELLGYRSVHFRCDRGNIKEIIEANAVAERRLLTGIDEFDAYTDWNMPHTNLLFKEFDRQYPGSKFILNTRSLEEWLDSREAHVRRTPDLERVRRKRPDSTWFAIDRQAWTDEWHELHDEARRHFDGRGDLIEMDMTAGDGWEILCPFLGVDVPSATFPRSNVTTSRSPRPNGVFHRVRRRVSELTRRH